jgi:hypothetical protein
VAAALQEASWYNVATREGGKWYGISLAHCKHCLSSSFLGPVDPSLRALSGRLELTDQSHKFNEEFLFLVKGRGGGGYCPVKQPFFCCPLYRPVSWLGFVVWGLGFGLCFVPLGSAFLESRAALEKLGPGIPQPTQD